MDYGHIAFLLIDPQNFYTLHL